MTSACRCLALAVALIVLATGCAAKTNPTASAGSEPPPPVVEVLPNGLTLVVQEHRAADIVAVHLWVATGVRYEKPDGLGYAHFQEHMLFKGTDTFGPGYIDRAIEGTGGRSNAFTTYDYTTFQILVPSDATKTAIESPRRHGLPLEVRSQGDRRRARGHLRGDAHPDGQSADRHRAGGLQRGLRRPSVRSPAARHTGDDEGRHAEGSARSSISKYYTPENMTLVVVGPVQAKAVRAMVDQTFGRRPRTGYTPPPEPVT